MNTLSLRKLLLLLPFISSYVYSQQRQDISRYLDAQTLVNDFSGTVIVAKGDSIIYKKGLGYANRELKVPNTAESKFRIGSLTKIFTAAIALQLVEEGKIKLEDPMDKFFPGYPKGDKVTIHMLLNHTSGIKNYTSLAKSRTIFTLPYPKDSMIALFKNEPYDFEPGNGWNYSNSGYFLLGIIIELVTRRSYEQELNDLSGRIGLKNTLLDHPDSILSNRASGYARNKYGLRNATYFSPEFTFSAGAMISTVEDLYKFSRALFKRNWIHQMSSTYRENYGYGLEIDTIFRQHRLGHGGNTPGFNAYLSYLPEKNLHIIILSNQGPSVRGIARALTAIMLGKKVVAPYVHKEDTIARKDLEKLTGKFVSATGPYEILLKDGKLFRRVNAGPDIEIKPESKDRFFYADGSDRYLNFVLNKNGTVKAVELITGDVAEELRRSE